MGLLDGGVARDCRLTYHHRLLLRLSDALATTTINLHLHLFGKDNLLSYFLFCLLFPPITSHLYQSFTFIYL